MDAKASFARKLISRLDKLDRSAVENYILELIGDLNQLETVLNQLGEGVLVIRTSGVLDFVNRSGEKFLNIQSWTKGKTRLADCVSDTELAVYLSRNAAACKTSFMEKRQQITPHEKTYEIRFVPLASDLSQKVVLIILTDVSESANVEFDQSRFARIESLIRLSAGLAHEIGNPLNTISIHLELLKKDIKTLGDPKKSVIEKTLKVLNDETSRLDKIVKKFLKAARKPPVRFRVDNLVKILEDAIEFMTPEFCGQGMSIQLKMDPQIPPFLMDRDRLYPAFINLMKNALEAMGSGGILKITATKKDNLVLVRFQDAGSGISDKDLPHIFEAYFTTKEEGSGLGLMTVYNSIVDHGGRIDVTSKPGKGSTFTLLLPIHKTRLQLPGASKFSGTHTVKGD